MPPTLTLATWNVNSLKVRLPHLLDWLTTHRVDIVCLQETKLVDDRFPVAALAEAGYAAAFAGQKTYNGVALLTRRETTRAASDVVVALPGLDDPQKRLIAATVGDLRVVCAYFPNGQSVGSEKYDYKLRWIAALNVWLRDELQRHPRLALAGDFNIAPEDRDVHDPKAWIGQVSVLRTREAGVSRPRRTRPGRQFSPVRPARTQLYVVGLPDAGVPPQDGTTHRPCAAVDGARAPLPRMLDRRRTASARAAERSRPGDGDACAVAIPRAAGSHCR